jgi:hypothetical protein
MSRIQKQDQNDMLKISESYPESESKKKQINNKNRYSKTPKPQNPLWMCMVTQRIPPLLIKVTTSLETQEIDD